MSRLSLRNIILSSDTYQWNEIIGSLSGGTVWKDAQVAATVTLELCLLIV